MTQSDTRFSAPLLGSLTFNDDGSFKATGLIAVFFLALGCCYVAAAIFGWLIRTCLWLFAAPFLAVGWLGHRLSHRTSGATHE